MVDWARNLQGRVNIESLQKNEFELGRVTAQRVILLFSGLCNNIYFVICIGQIPKYRDTLTSHSVTIDTSSWNLTLSALRRTAGIFIHDRPFLASTVLVVISILPGRASLSGLTLRVKLPVAADPWANTGPSTWSTPNYYQLYLLPIALANCCTY